MSNSFSDEDCIVDVRDAITNEILPYNKFINRYVMRVEPHRAILETDYFIKLIEEAERNRDEEIERVEAGSEEKHDQLQDEPGAANNAEWAKI